MNVEEQLTAKANELGVSPAKLKVVYTRGVDECLSQGYQGKPSLYGLVRVQRFVAALATSNARVTEDSDLLPSTSDLPYEPSTTLEVSGTELAYLPVVMDVLSGQSAQIMSVFPQDSVTATSYDVDTKELTICGDVWACTISLATGETKILTNDKPSVE